MPHPKLHPICVGPFTYGPAYDPSTDSFCPCLHIPMRRDDVGPNAYEDVARDSYENIRDILWAEFRYPSHWKGHPLLDPSLSYLQAQLSHYGLERYETKKDCRERLRKALREGKLKVPDVTRGLEVRLKVEYEHNKKHQEEAVTGKMKRVDEEVMNVLEQKDLVGLKKEQLRMWETDEGITAFKKKTVRGRHILGFLQEKILNLVHPEGLRQQWQNCIPLMVNKVEQMEVMVQMLEDGTFWNLSEEYLEYRAVYDRIDQETLEEHLESLRYRDRLYDEANEDEITRMKEPLSTPTLLGDLVNALIDSRGSLAGSHSRTGKKHEWVGNLSGFSDGFYGKNIHNDIEELNRRYREWEMLGQCCDSGTPQDWSAPEESEDSRRAGASDWQDWYKGPTPEEKEKTGARAHCEGAQQGWNQSSYPNPGGRTSRPGCEEASGNPSAKASGRDSQPRPSQEQRQRRDSIDAPPRPSSLNAYAKPPSSHALTSTTRTPKHDLRYLAIQRVLKCKPNDYHQIMAVQKRADESEIRGAFLNLSLLLHPDKNTHPGADKAFKKMEAAYRVLQPR